MVCREASAKSCHPAQNGPTNPAKGVSSRATNQLGISLGVEVTEETTMQTKSIRVVLVVIVLLFMCDVTMFTQESKTPAGQTPLGTNNAYNNITDQDIKMLRSDLRATRAALTEGYVPLTADEGTKFWPIFDQYQAEARKLSDELWAEIKDYAANYDNLTDTQAQDYIQKTADVDQKLIALRVKYVPIFEKIISPKKTALWYQVDRRIDMMTNLQLSTKIPLAKISQ
jgi:hypothetical protein